jgi:hypothetical protein
MEGLDRIELVEQNTLQENQGSKTLCAEENLTGRKVQHAGNPSKSEKSDNFQCGTIVTSSFCYKVRKRGGSDPLCYFLRIRTQSRVEER